MTLGEQGFLPAALELDFRFTFGALGISGLVWPLVHVGGHLYK